MAAIRFVVEGEPVGAPRQTQSDRWRLRPCVVRYRAFRDRVRAAAGPLPEAVAVASLDVLAVFAPPASWSMKRRAAAMGQPHRAKPDGDNVLKAVADALWEQDSGLADCRVRKVWGCPERVEVEVRTETGGAT